MRQSRHSSREVRSAAKALRQAETPAEQRLWRVLRGRAVNGLKFRRQHPLHGCVLDFFCAEVGLCVELDGSVHDDPHQRERDGARTAHLAAHGIRVIRFRNEEVLHDLPTVLQRIARAAAQTGQTAPV
jgi:very-short-patch-repair endonuclease